jgi:hypothetical protein
MFLLLHVFFNKNFCSRREILRSWRLYNYIRFLSFLKLDELAEFYTGKFLITSHEVIQNFSDKIDTSRLEDLHHGLNQELASQLTMTESQLLIHVFTLWNGITHLIADALRRDPLLSKVRLASFICGLIAFLGIVSLHACWDNIPLVRQLKTAKTNIQLKELNSIFSAVKAKYGLPLSVITGRGCSYCPCRTGTDLRNTSTNDICVKQWRDSVTKILALSGMEIAQIKTYYEDAWGSPFGLDELDSPGSCNADNIISPGPSGIFGTPDNIKTILEKKFCN